MNYSVRSRTKSTGLEIGYAAVHSPNNKFYINSWQLYIDLQYIIPAQSIVNKHYELQWIVDTYNPDIIGLTETWLNDKMSD